MLDFRYDTFLELCKTKNYTRAAKNLHVSQPTVTQHIHYLEDVYQGKLFNYDGKNLTLTRRGEQLRHYVRKLAAESRFIKQQIIAADRPLQIFLGATCTVGEFILPSILSKCMAEDPGVSFNMVVEYKEILLQQLLDGEIQFAYFDGDFDTKLYTGIPFLEERLVPVCSPHSPLKGREVSWEELFAQKLIAREVGIDSRDYLEQCLKARSLDISRFQRIQEICNITAIKHLVEENVGIALLYESNVRRELENGTLARLKIKELNEKQVFYFVYLRDTLHEDQILSTYALLKENYSG